MQNRLFTGMILCCFIFFGTSVFASTNKLAGEKLAFERYQISAPFNVNIPVISIDLITNDEFPANELVVIGEDNQGQMWLAVYVFDESKADFGLLGKLALSNEYFAFDVSENNQGLYFLAKNEVVSLSYDKTLVKTEDPAAGLYLQPKQKITSMYLINQSSFIAKKDFIQDVNGDGIDDIILPDFEQTNFWLAQPNKQEYFYQSLPIIPTMELNRNGVNFEPVKIFFADVNLDEKQDIIWISAGKLHYFSQTLKGDFATQQLSLDLADTIQGLHWWQIKESDGQSLDQSNLTHRVVEQIKDINGDGFVDVIVRYTQSSGVLDRANDYEFYFGNLNKEEQFEFAKTPNTVIKAEGTLTGLKIVDVNNDGKFEVLLSSFELSVSNIIGALLSGGIDQNVLLFAIEDDGRYSQDSIINEEVELNFSLTSGQSGQPIVLLTDVDGDGLQDLILSSGDEKLKIFAGQNSDRLFNRKATTHKILFPKDGALFEHFDINRDGKEDFIMRYGRLDDESMANKVTILLVK